MSLERPPPSSRETTASAIEQQGEQPSSSSSYKASQPSPKVQSRDSMDSAFLQEFYGPPSPQEPKEIIVSKRRKSMEDPPALPERSALRASRMFDNLNVAKLAAEPSPMTQSTPHSIYLSSEEEASSSADDFSDYDFSDEEYESDSEQSQKSPVRRKSHEDTARVVSVIFSGRPSIVDVSASRRSPSPASVDIRPRTSITSNSSRPSTSAAVPPNHKPHPPRSSSMMLPPTMNLAKHQPHFLNTDPFPNNGTYDLGEEDIPRAPKSPGAVLKSVSRTFSLVRKRSRPLLNTNHSTPGSTPENNDSSADPRLERSQTPQSSHSSNESSTSPPNLEKSVFHSESVPRRESSLPLPPPPPRTPASPAGAVKGILAMARRRSIHIRAAGRA